LNHHAKFHAFAKINLGLSILGLRPDGYHEIRTVYQTVGLHDRLSVELGPGAGIDVSSDDPKVPGGNKNLVYQIAARWKRARKFRGKIRFRIEKRIPSGAGLGGGSSDAAAALLALERLTGDRLSPAARFRLAAEAGSDVPFFLWGGRALGLGRGEAVYPLPNLARTPCLVVFPGRSVSTAEAYQEAGRRLTKKRGTSSMEFFGARPHFFPEISGPAENDFEAVIFARWPELASLKRRLIRAGAKVASLTGSGSAVFALFDSGQKLRHATKLIPKEWKFFSTVTVSREEYHERLFEE
jgi:4-diphosphocytidyl-2-C-methyl-D-erythritol kinase